MQLFTVPPWIPAPVTGSPSSGSQHTTTFGALAVKDKLPDTTQLETTAVVASHHTPPPESATPCVTVKPEMLASLVRYTQRLDPPASIIVNCGPLTLRKINGLPTTTLLYVPLVTTASSPAT